MSTSQEAETSSESKVIDVRKFSGSSGAALELISWNFDREQRHPQPSIGRCIRMSGGDYWPKWLRKEYVAMSINQYWRENGTGARW